MHAFSISRDVAFSTQHGWRRIAGTAPDGRGGLDPARVTLAIHDEDGFARRALGDAGAEFSVYAEADLAKWPGFPIRLGRSPEGEGDPALAGGQAPLYGQLAMLRERHPGRHHLRVALLGGFGFNLGDTLMGATAWRIVLPALRAALGSVSAGVLMGPIASPAVAELIGHEEGIDEVLFASPTLQGFSRYDAFFDFTGLVGLPRFHEGPALDWILWWLGLAPEDVPPSAKRNRLRLPTQALAWARERLEGRSGPRVMFVWRASTPLRSMPDEIAVRLASDLLGAAPDITLVTERNLGLDHPRVLDLGADTDRAVRMMALVAECDGLLTVDSLALHIADAADVPTALLPSSYPATRFPFYPNMRALVPPGMETLPGWNATKVADELWDGMRDGYARAWSGVEARDCWAALSERMAARPVPEDRIAVDEGGALDRGRTALPSAGLPFARDFMAPLDAWLAAECARLVLRALEPGKVAVQAGGWSGDLALRLAMSVSPGGAVHILEPRRLRAQKLAAHAQAAGIPTLQVWPAAAGERPDLRTIPDFDPLGEAYPASWGNLDAGVTVAVMALDDLPVEDCHALVIGAPQEIPRALAGAVGMLRRTGAVVVAGPVRAAEAADLRQTLGRADYRGFLCWADRDRRDVALLVAAPESADVRFEGFDAL